MKIKKLSPHIISQIAAGEVIERPAYAVKELIENAIDASAKTISIYIEDSGLKRITVSDDGNGMKKEDLLVSFLPHTTSKISTEEDIHAITSLGFRGEALSSIASISEMTIQSRHRNELSGFKVELSRGKVIQTSAIGMPPGTTVMLSNIFGHVPARKKFLKTARTELRLILDIVSDYILLYPKIAFTFTHNNRDYFTISAHHDLDRRIRTVLGDSLFVNLIPVTHEESYVKITGYIARPQYSIKGTSKLFIFINGRRIIDPIIGNAVKDAYKNLLEYGAYPIALLYLSLPPEMIDVNIHPRKQEVRFLDPTPLYSTVSKAVAETLQNNNLTFLNVSWKDGGTKTHLGKILKTELMEDIDHIKKEADVLQLHDLYLITETKKGMIIVDQHAAHEAILFRKLKIQYEKHKTKGKSLELGQPLLLDLSPSDKEVILEYAELFRKLGFEMEEFGEMFRINIIPEIFKDRDISDLIHELIEDLRAERLIPDIDRRTYRMLSYLACRTAIKAGTPLSQEKMKELIANLIDSDMTYTCPHGRPVKVEISLSVLHKMFKR